MIRRNRYFLIGLVIIMALTAFMVRNLKAETLTPVQPGTDWTFVVAMLVILVAVGGGIYLIRRHPTQASAVSTTIAEELSKIRGMMEITHAPPVLTEIVPEPVKGKNGQAGIFTLEVTGDPKVDIPAINLRYFN